MSFNEQSASDFLEGKDTDFDEEKALEYLKSEGTVTPEEPTLDTEQPQVDESGQVQLKKDFMQNVGDYAAAANDVLLDTLGLPSDAFNWVAQKMGMEGRVYGSKEIRDLGSKIRIGYEQGQEPDTPYYKAGKYTGMGLQFLAPILHAGRGAEAAVKMGRNVTTTTGVGEAIATTTAPRGIAQQIAAPFYASGQLTMKIPKTGITVPMGNSALMTELSTSTMAGVGAYYGEKEYGYIGELLGGLGGGLAASITPWAAPRITEAAKKTAFGFTEAGGRHKASLRLKELSETKGVVGKIDKATGEVLKSSKIPPAKLSGDKHLIALQNRILKDDPELAHKFQVEMEATNANARRELERLKFGANIRDTQAYLGSRVARTTMLINRRLDNALSLAQSSLSKLNPSSQRKTINQVVSKQIDGALGEAKLVETEAWKKVPVDILGKAKNTKSTYVSELKNRYDAQGVSTADPADIPSYISAYFGSVKKGKFVKGSLSENPSIKSLQGIRSRVLQSRRDELAKDAPNMNKARILNDIQESLLKDMAETKGGNQLSEAVAVSRTINDKFKGGVMDTILGHEKSGGRIAPEISLESIKGGGKAAVQMKEVLAASPESYGMLEELTKVHLANSSIVNSKGRINVSAAKKYIYKNEDMLDMFPNVKKDLEKSIGLEEKALSATTKAKERLIRTKNSTAAQIAEAKPKTALNTILDSTNPKKAMKDAYRKSNIIGKHGLRSDVIDYLLTKAKTGKFDENDMPILSGQKMSNIWKNNKDVFMESLDSSSAKRLDVIINTLKKNEDVAGLPDVPDIVVPANKIIGMIAGTWAARQGAMLGKGTSGASLRTASMATKAMNKFMDNLDVTKAKQLLKDAISDPELFKAIYTDTSKFKETVIADQVFQSWLLSHTFMGLDINGVSKEEEAPEDDR